MYKLEQKTDSVLFSEGPRRLRISFITESIVRLTVTENKPFKTEPGLIVQTKSSCTNYQFEEHAEDFRIVTIAMKVVIRKDTGAVSYFDAQGHLLVSEPERGGKWLTAKDVYRNVYKKETQAACGQGIDGARAEAGDGQSVFDRHAFEAKLEFVFDETEAIFGFGSHEEGYGNLRGKSRDLYQQNMKAVVPAFVSTKGYGFLLDCCSLMNFHDDAWGTYIWADVVDELDYYFVCGGGFDDVVGSFHVLTGKSPMLPKWAFGYIQCKERYVNAKELLDIVKEYRKHKIPLDLIVLDWKSWPAGKGWGQKSFDPIRFPDPDGFIKELHQMGAKIMISIWPIMTGDCPDQRQLLERGWMLGNQSTYNAFNKEARQCYWDQANRGLFRHGIDAWWCDCTEPFEADWSGAVKPERHNRLLINTEQSKKYIDAGYINAYSLLHSQGIYEGQRQETGNKRVVNLTRSSYAGQHRYATITWSGDITATWESLRRSIPEGLNFCATGESYWTVDIGGFFIKNDPMLWFWRGDYEAGCRGLTDMNAIEPDPKDTGCTDLGYWELYTRWLQYGAFLPLFRSHGTDAAREIWRFGQAGTPFYDTIAKYIKFRYQFLPYIYSLAAKVTRDSYTMMRAAALDYPRDVLTYNLTDQYLFGPAFMVCPVTRPMYYNRNSEPIRDADKSRKVYLPRGNAWYDFWTNRMFEGGQEIQADAPLETMPLFVKSGSIIPMSPVMQYADEIPDAPYEIRVYTDRDGHFELYEDEGDNYNYEKGEYSIVKLSWNDRRKELLIFQREGAFASLVKERKLNLVFISPNGKTTREVLYTGQQVRLSAE